MDETLEQAVALEEEGYAAFKAGDADRSRRLNEESLEIARRLRDPAATVRALAGLMRLALRERDFRTVERLALECDELAQAHSDPSLRRMPIHMRAEAARMNGDLDRARSLYDESIALNRDQGNTQMVHVELANKAWAEIAASRFNEAEKLLQESLELAAADDAYGKAFCLLGTARIELERGRTTGVQTLGRAEQLLAEAGLVWDPAEEEEHARTASLARVVAGEQAGELRAT